MLADFFKERSGQLSMSRLLSFASFFPATIELIRINSETALGIYVGAFVLNYVGGKFGEGRLPSPNEGQ